MNRLVWAIAGMAAINTGVAQPAPVIFTPAVQAGVHIDAESMDVSEWSDAATFREAEFAQGDFRLRCRTLIVRYHPASSDLPAAVQQIECFPQR